MVFKRSKTEIKKSDTIEHVATGFASPAQEFLENKLDLNTLIAPHPEATFFIKLSELSVKTKDTTPGDLLVVDRSMDWRDNSMILAVIEGEFQVGHVRKVSGRIFFTPETEGHKSFPVTEDIDFQIWGVVTHIIRKL